MHLRSRGPLLSVLGSAAGLVGVSAAGPAEARPPAFFLLSFGYGTGRKAAAFPGPKGQMSRRDMANMTMIQAMYARPLRGRSACFGPTDPRNEAGQNVADASDESLHHEPLHPAPLTSLTAQHLFWTCSWIRALAHETADLLVGVDNGDGVAPSNSPRRKDNSVSSRPLPTCRGAPVVTVSLGLLLSARRRAAP